MPRFKYSKGSDRLVMLPDGAKKKLLVEEAFNRFNSQALGLGDLSTPSEAIDSIAAVFDLEGFTHFSKQIEPHLSVPLFLSSFLEWLMEQLRTEMRKDTYPEGIELWCPLPYFVKFMGDGLLALWDSTGMSAVARRNVITSCDEICQAYREEFYPYIRKKVSEPPTALRCGVARGTVFSVGNGEDYVGACINMASRIQKLPGLSFAFNRRGFDLEADGSDSFFMDNFIIKEISIRGIGNHELICIYRADFENLGDEDRAMFRDV